MPRNRRLVWAAAIALLGAASFAAAAGSGHYRNAAADALLGCYEQAYGPWTEEDIDGGENPFHRAPARFRLEDARGEDVYWPGVTGRVAVPIGEPFHVEGRWDFDGGTLRVGWMDQYTGPAFTFRRAGNAFVGTAQMFWDGAGGFKETAPARAWRVACPPPDAGPACGGGDR